MAAWTGIRKPRVNTDRMWAGFWGFILLSAMSLMAYFGFGKPVRSMFAARGWSPATCEIIRSAVRRSGEGGNSSFSVEVAYRYVVGVHSYIGYRERFTAISSNRSSDARGRVRSLPPGSEVRCWYDPVQPTESVLDRDPDTDLFWIVIPLAFGALGAALFGWAIFGDWSPSPKGAPAAVATAGANDELNAGGTFLVAVGIFMAFGLAAGMAAKAAVDWRRGYGMGSSPLAAVVLATVGVRIVRYLLKYRRRPRA